MYNVKRTEFADNLQFYADSASIHTQNTYIILCNIRIDVDECLT